MISVISPVYNVDHYLRTSIQSILNQNIDFELILVNDGSTDTSEEIILSFKDPRIRYFLEPHRGLSATLNKGFKEAKGDYIAFHDPDDISLPGRLEIMKEALLHSNASFVHSDVILINENDHPIGYKCSYNVNLESSLRHFLRFNNPFTNPTVLLKKSIIKGMTFDENLVIGMDLDYVSKISAQHIGVHIPEPLYAYRVHSTSLMKTQYNRTTRDLYQEKLYTNFSIEALIPEAFYITQNDSGLNQAIAYCILYYIFTLKTAIKRANEFLETAKALGSNNQNFLLFIDAMKLLARKEYEESIAILIGLGKEFFPHIISNYIGEGYMLKGDFNKAYQYFFKALQLYPNYMNALQNLKTMGYILVAEE